VTPEITADKQVEPTKNAPSTAGMTTKVVKGSVWTLAGSVAPLAVSFISIPFVIRFLGTESYGVLLLVGLIPTYFAFADFGMGIASTKFASEAYGQGDERREAEIVWTATLIAAISALIIAVPIFLFSYQIVTLLNVPEHLLSQASIALKIASGSFFLGVQSSILNSPLLARLRMDLNMLTSAIPKILLAAVTPVILYFGGGIVEAVGWAFIVAAGTLAVVIYFSTGLLPGLLSASFNRDLMRPLLKFGGGWLLAVMAAILVANVEKLFLTQMVSVKALAYYSVAFSVAMMATVFSQAMVQSLVPAFSRLDRATSRAELERLLSRSIRINILWLLPTLTVMFVAAKPLFSVWAGEDFGTESVLPFYILLASLFF
jgi:O-antigen/teichoic acid export membrane protein